MRPSGFPLGPAELELFFLLADLPVPPFFSSPFDALSSDERRRDLFGARAGLEEAGLLQAASPLSRLTEEGATMLLTAAMPRNVVSLTIEGSLKLVAYEGSDIVLALVRECGSCVLETYSPAQLDDVLRLSLGISKDGDEAVRVDMTLPVSSVDSLLSATKSGPGAEGAGVDSRAIEVASSIVSGDSCRLTVICSGGWHTRSVVRFSPDEAFVLRCDLHESNQFARLVACSHSVLPHVLLSAPSAS